MSEPDQPQTPTRVLSVETGFSCNAYCAFCPQISYRKDGGAQVPLDLRTDEIRERIRYGAEHGYRQIGFSGGEVTIRPDFPELVAYAHSLGYDLIGMTTNGMMLAYLQYAAKLVKAGLSSVNVSVFGHTAKLHDGLMRTPGSFELAMKALDNLQLIERKTGRRIDKMSMCIAAPQALENYAEHVRLMGEKGVRLHMVQPFLLTKGNSDVARYFISSYEAIATAVRAGVLAAARHGGRMKLFNTPVCLFWDLADKVERQWKELDVFREHEAAAPGESRQRATPEGYYRVDECATCDEPCNGFRIEYYPQDQMVREILAAVREHLAAHGTQELWLGGFELLAPASIEAVLRGARGLGAQRLVMVTAGIGRSYHEQFEIGIASLVDDVCLVVRPPRAGARASEDRHEAHGNLADVRRAVTQLRCLEAPPGIFATLLVDDVRDCPEAVDLLEALGVEEVAVALSERAGGMPGWDPDEVGPPLSALLARGFVVRYLGKTAPRIEGLGQLDPDPRWVRHRFVSPELDWIGWSVPLWARQDRLVALRSPSRVPAAAQ